MSNSILEKLNVTRGAMMLGKKPSSLWIENDKESLRIDDALWLLNTIEKVMQS